VLKIAIACISFHPFHLLDSLFHSNCLPLWQGNKQLRIRTVGFLVSNALMLTTPFKALAETCEANDSVFNMNMPLLLGVALIGATVGGKVLLVPWSPLLPFFTITLKYLFGIYMDFSIFGRVDYAFPKIKTKKHIDYCIYIFLSILMSKCKKVPHMECPGGCGL
jgi:hypothetical protein